MSEPKPVQMWAVFDPEDKLCLGTIQFYRGSAQRSAVRDYADVMDWDDGWRNLEIAGYLCIRVTLTPDPESEK